MAAKLRRNSVRRYPQEYWNATLRVAAGEIVGPFTVPDPEGAKPGTGALKWRGHFYKFVQAVRRAADDYDSALRRQADERKRLGEALTTIDPDLESFAALAPAVERVVVEAVGGTIRLLPRSEDWRAKLLAEALGTGGAAAASADAERSAAAFAARMAASRPEDQ